MIFVTLGSQKFQFNRLLESIDKLVENKYLPRDVFAQIGYSDYIPKNYKYIDFLNRDEFLGYQKKADIIITHGGTGAIIGALKNGKKVIAVPRLAKYGEHVDDHQIQIVNEFEELNYICSCLDVSDLKNIYEKALKTNFQKYVSNTDKYIREIEAFIEKM